MVDSTEEFELGEVGGVPPAKSDRKAVKSLLWRTYKLVGTLISLIWFIYLLVTLGKFSKTIDDHS